MVVLSNHLQVAKLSCRERASESFKSWSRHGQLEREIKCPQYEMNKVARKMASMPPAYIQTVQEKGKNIENRIYTSCSLGNFHRIIIFFFFTTTQTSIEAKRTCYVSSRWMKCHGYYYKSTNKTQEPVRVEVIVLNVISCRSRLLALTREQFILNNSSDVSTIHFCSTESANILY